VPVGFRETEAGAVRARLDAVEGRVSVLKAEGKLTVHAPGANGTTPIFVAARKPSQMHVEVLDFFGRPTVVLVSDGTRFGLWEADKGTYWEGPASAANVSRFLPVTLAPEELVALLFGEAPPFNPGPETLSFDERDGVYRLVSSSAGARSVSVDPETFRVRGYETSGASGYHARFEDFGSGPEHLPKKLSLDAPGAKARLELRYTGVELNPSLPANLFAPAAPKGARIEQVDAEGRSVAP
jgi:hypothetical protein